MFFTLKKISHHDKLRDRICFIRGMNIMAFKMKTLAGMICAATMFTFGTAWAAEPEGIDINIADVTREQAAAVASAQVELHEEELIPKVNDGTKIMINLANRGLYLFEKGVKTKLYPIACGRYTNRSPVGYYKVNEKEVNPTWVDPADRSNVVTSGPSNPLGYRWIGFNGYYGIHGTNNPSSIGTYASKGCIRMLEEDVEDLYERVEVGTPVEVFYNRCVMEKSNDGTVVYYIYPDAYDCQPLSVEQINEWLHGYGVECFESDDAIKEKIAAEDGQPTFVAKPFNLTVNGKTLEWKAVQKDGIYYLPVYQMAEALNMAVYVDNAAGMVRTSYGTATINNFKNVLYINADEAEAIFNINGGKYSSNSMVYTTNPPKKTAEVTNSDTGTKVNETAVFNRKIDPVRNIEPVKK